MDKNNEVTPPRAGWTLRRWLVVCVAAMAATLMSLVAVVGTTYRASDHSREAADAATAMQVALQRYLRGLNEVLLSDGSSSARQLVEGSATAFRASLAAQAGTDAVAQVQAGWAKLEAEGRALLAHKGVSASDDKSMIAYGRIAGLSEDLVKQVTAIEAAATESARRASRTLLLAGVIGSALALALLLAVGYQINRVVFRRLGGEPALARDLALRLARHDLAVEFPAQVAGNGQTVIDALRQIRDNLRAVVGHVREGAEAVATMSEQIARGNDDLSGRTEQQASSLQVTASSMTQLGATVKGNADSAREADALAREASAVASGGGEVVAQVVETMRGINDSSRRIADIIGVIDGIAFQTNILALNAAVEAARAGEQGRGFAVVAAEVRTLAQRSASAAREIKTLISASVERVEQGSAQVDRAGATMQQIVGAIRRVTEIVGEISTASHEQSQGVGQVGQAIDEMDHATQQNAALVEQSAAAAASLRQQARDLVHSVAVFRLREQGSPA